MISPRESFYVGHLGPIPLYIHWSSLFLVFLLWQFSGASFDLRTFAGFLLIVLVSIILHEMGHGLAARAIARSESERSVTITLWAFGGVCHSTGNHQALPRLFVVLAGPAVSLALWGLGEAALATPQILQALVQHELALRMVYLFTVVNLGLLIFNMLPIYPLDGGQALYNTLKLGLRDYAIAAKATMAISVVCAVGYFAYDMHQRGSPSLFLGLILAWSLWSAWLSLSSPSR